MLMCVELDVVAAAEEFVVMVRMSALQRRLYESILSSASVR